jgi:hypothetical protein
MAVLLKLALAGAAACGLVYATDAGSESRDLSIPPNYRALYEKSGNACPHLTWHLLAGVGKIETDHGRSPLRGVHSGENPSHAKGPMQFLGATFASVRRHHTDVKNDIYDEANAIPAAAYYLCESGVADDHVMDALLTYNHDYGYAFDVQDWADDYAEAYP